LKTITKTTGLRYWMRRVLEECDHVAADFSADPVHDLRVSLRRCRSMADGLMAIDPDPEWKAMKKAGKRLFQRMGDLRDIQIMMEWIEKLHPTPAGVGAGDSPAQAQSAESSAESSNPASVTDPRELGSGEPESRELESGEKESGEKYLHDPAAHALLGILRHREGEQKHEARAALEEFDRKQWRQWSKTLPLRAAHVRPGSSVFKHLALERWTAARELHSRAMRNRSQIALHTLRIGIKRFRYIVENFLPAEHKAWSDDLKHLQDLLGEVHDLDVLWATALTCRVFPNEDSRKAWHGRILKQRTKRVDEYREKTVGPESLWNFWRAGLPQGKQIQEIATQRMKLWAKVLDPDFAHSERVARLALELYDGLNKARLLGSAEAANGKGPDVRASLYAAALLHDVGKSKGNKGHHKASRELIQRHGAPLGWSAEAVERAAVVARFHCGALPSRSHKMLRDLLPDEQREIIRLAAILRLSNAFDAAHDGHILRVQIEGPATESHAAASRNRHKRGSNGFLRKPAAMGKAAMGKNEPLLIAAEGYADGTPTAQAIAAERYLLETVLRRPVVVKPMKSAPTKGRS
jgi:CHAD domain-containing protein/HD superfamily phosphodiesterase